jgi:hypothetical protein
VFVHLDELEKSNRYAEIEDQDMSRSTPEDANGIVVYLPDQPVNIGVGIEVPVAQPAAVSIGPIEGPLERRRVVSKLRYLHPRSFRDVLREALPRRAALEDRGAVPSDAELKADLIADMSRDPSRTELSDLLLGSTTNQFR